MNPVRPAPSRGRLRWTLRMPRPVAVRDAGAACLAGGRQWPQGGAGCTAAPARGREPPPAWNSRARRAGGMGDAPQSRGQRRGNAARHGRCSLRCAGCWTERYLREASAGQTPMKVLDERAHPTGFVWPLRQTRTAQGQDRCAGANSCRNHHSMEGSVPKSRSVATRWRQYPHRKACA